MQYVLEELTATECKHTVLNCSFEEAKELEHWLRKLNPSYTYILFNAEDWLRLKSMPPALVKTKANEARRDVLDRQFPVETEATLLESYV